MEAPNAMVVVVRDAAHSDSLAPGRVVRMRHNTQIARTARAVVVGCDCARMLSATQSTAA